MRQDARVRHDVGSTPAHRGPRSMLIAAAITGAIIGTTTDPTARLASALAYTVIFTLGALILHLLIAFVRDTLEG